MSEQSEQHSRSFFGELSVIAYRSGQIWKLIPGGQRWTLLAAVLLMFLGGAFNTAIPVLLGRLVDTVKVSHADGSSSSFPPSAVTVLLLIGAAFLFREVLQVGRRYLVEYTCTRLQQHLFVTLVSHLLMGDLSVLSKEKVGALHGRMQRSVSGSVKFLRVGFLDFLPALFSGGLALSAVVAKQPWLGLMMAGVVPLSLGITIRQLVSQKGVRLDLMRCQEEMDGTLVEQLGGIDDIRAANTHEREVERVKQSSEHLRVHELHHHFVMSLYGSSKAISEGLIHVLVLAGAVYFASTGRITIGDILTYSMLFLSVMAPLNEVHRVMDEGHESSLLVGELLTFLEEPPDRSFQVAAPRTPDLDQGALQTEDLRINYVLPDGTQRCAVEGLTLSIDRGETIGIAGRSGCGKSTLLRTLLRLVHPESGEMLLGGVPLNDVSREDIARLIGYVSQTPFVFSGTIAENIAYERIDASEEEIRRAAELAGLHDEIMQMAGGYGAVISERGHNLSGGQRQRLALARVFLKDPPILILDEATSALDTISERQIQEALANHDGGRTVILVAHRLSTLAHTDRVFVFEDGRLVETGAYDDLVTSGGEFTRLVQSATEPLDQSATRHGSNNHSSNGHVACSK